MTSMIERVARAIKEETAYWLPGDTHDKLYERAARAAIEATGRDWRVMDTAPTDGTVIEVVGRYPEATAGFPQYVGFRDGKWWHFSKHEPLEVIPWAWRPRTDWPDEAMIDTALSEQISG